MSAVASNRACAEDVRQLVYERLSSSFIKDVPFEPGSCSICGATGVEVNKDGRCRAQAALAQKRDTAAEGHPIAFGSPQAGKPKFSMIDANCAILVEPEVAIFTGKVLPTSPLPPGAEVRAELDISDLLDRVSTDPRLPYFIGVFDKKANMKLEMVSDASTIVLNGTEPVVRLDSARLRQLVALVEEFGAKAVRKVSTLRQQSSTDLERAHRTQAEVEKISPAIMTRIVEFPVGEEAELTWAIAIVRARERRMKAAA